MNALALVPPGIVLPAFDSYQWIVVNTTMLSHDDRESNHVFLHRLFVEHQPVGVVSFGQYETWVKLHVATMPYGFARLWVHLEDPTVLREAFLTKVFLKSGPPNRILERPLISVITSTFQSDEKLQRAYQSLQDQSYDH